MREFDGKCFQRKINQHEKRVSQEREFVFVAKEDVNGGWVGENCMKGGVLIYSLVDMGFVGPQFLG